MFRPIAAIIRFALSRGVQLKYVCSLLSYVGLQLLFFHSDVYCRWAFAMGSVQRRENQRIRADVGR